MKRLNPKTGKIFQMGDKRADGKVFNIYRTKKLQKDGYFSEYWVNPKKLSWGKKRINPETGKIFKKGDKRKSDNKTFYGYRKFMGEDGYCQEMWRTPRAEHKIKINIKRRRDKIHKYFKRGKIKKRINPETGIEFVIGDTRKDGAIFNGYNSNQKTKDGFIGETWNFPNKYHIARIKKTIQHCKIRAKKKKIKFNLDSNYLQKIFPKNFICPVLNIKLVWGIANSNTRNSPSVDRINPTLGYTKGNVRWVSNLCNTLKTEKNFKDIEKIYFDMKKIMKK